MHLTAVGLGDRDRHDHAWVDIVADPRFDEQLRVVGQGCAAAIQEGVDPLGRDLGPVRSDVDQRLGALRFDAQRRERLDLGDPLDRAQRIQLAM